MATFCVVGSRLVCARPMADGDRVILCSSGTLPAPLTAAVVWHVVESDCASFALAAAPGGPAVELSDEGLGVHVVRPEETMVTGLELCELVADWFALRGDETVVVFGHREPGKQINQARGRANRITVTPGDDTGKAGSLEGGKWGFGRRRQIATWIEPLTWTAWGIDTSRPNDEGAQYQATRALFERMLEALRSAQCGRFQLRDPKWTTVPVERSFGRALSIVVELETPVERRSEIGRLVIAPAPFLAAQIDPGTMVYPSSEIDVLPID